MEKTLGTWGEPWGRERIPGARIEYLEHGVTFGDTEGALGARGVTPPGCGAPCRSSSSCTLTLLLHGQQRGGDHLGGLGGLVPAVCHCWGQVWGHVGIGGSRSSSHSRLSPLEHGCHPPSIPHAWQDPRVARLGDKRTQKAQISPR